MKLARSPHRLRIAPWFCLWLAACDCHAGLPELFYDDLETLCGDAPCDWQLEAGSVASIATVHSAEHGIRIASGTRLTHPLDVAIVAESSPQQAPQIHVLASCERDTRLRFIVEVDSGEASDLIEATLVGPRNEDNPLPLVQIDLLRPDGSAPGDGRALRFTLEVEGPGSCILDELRIVEKTIQSDC